ncbi:MAG: RluA family pseudouridine synthase [Treponema sp.]|nr:RluA family pseudouridine synthase [Treponema sp.]
MPFFSSKVPDSFLGTERLDKYISSLPNGFNRSKLKSGVHEILINSQKAKLSSKVRAGDQIDIQWEDNVPDSIMPEDIPLKIIYEDQNVAVVNKEQGMVTHPAAGNWSGTLVNALLHHWGRDALGQIKEGETSQMLARRRPGIVHRLDKDTSGIIITAKNRESEEWLQNQFQGRRLKKEYVLIVRGCPPKRDGVVDTYITRDPADRKRFKAVDLEGNRRLEKFGEDAVALPVSGKRAVTLYHVVAVYSNYTLVRVRLKTGRTHQIRVHMKYLGCPVLGDAIYSKKDNYFPDENLMLHSRLLEIQLPGQTKKTAFKAAIPERFKRVIKKLKAQYLRAYCSEGIKVSEAERAKSGESLQGHKGGGQ